MHTPLPLPLPLQLIRDPLANTPRHPDVQKFKPTALKMGKAVRHRGPDWSGNWIANDTSMEA
jgi:asparagine synthetase B (glutamine-hydrolysing)